MGQEIRYFSSETLSATLERNFTIKKSQFTPELSRHMATKLQITKNAIDRAQGKCRGEKKCIVPFGEKTWGKDTTWKMYIRKGADKSLSLPISQCRRTESIVSLARGVCSCAELQVFSCYRGWKEVCQATRAISTTSRRELSLILFFPARQNAEGNSRRSDRNIRGTCIIVCHRQKLGGTV